jgi:O-antigen/teichoic acid export membrane protein
VFYPEVARLVASGEHVTVGQLVRQGTVCAALCGLAPVILMGVLGHHLMHLLAGRHFDLATPTLLLIGVASAIELARCALEPLLLARGKAGPLLLAKFGGFLAFAAGLALFLPPWAPPARLERRRWRPGSPALLLVTFALGGDAVKPKAGKA